MSWFYSSILVWFTLHFHNHICRAKTNDINNSSQARVLHLLCLFSAVYWHKNPEIPGIFQQFALWCFTLTNQANLFRNKREMPGFCTVGYTNEHKSLNKKNYIYINSFNCNGFHYFYSPIKILICIFTHFGQLKWKWVIAIQK